MKEENNIFDDIVCYEQKCLCVFVIDTFRLKNDMAINEVALGIQRILEGFESDETCRERVEVSFITYESLSDEIHIVQGPVPISQAAIPSLVVTTDDTSLTRALYMAMDVVEKQVTWYKNVGIPYYRPCIFLISNGMSLFSCNIDEIANRIKQDTSNKKYVFLPIYTEDAEVPLLQEIESGVPITALDSLNITDRFKWLSSSIGTIVSAEEGQQADLSAEPSDWMDAFTIDGSEEEIDMDCLPNFIQDELITDNDTDGCSPSNNEVFYLESETTGCIGDGSYDLDFNPITGEFKTEIQDSHSERSGSFSALEEHLSNASDMTDVSDSEISDATSFNGSYEIVFNPKTGLFEQSPSGQIDDAKVRVTEMTCEGFAGPPIKEREKTGTTFEVSIGNEKTVANRRGSFLSRIFKKRIVHKTIYSSIFAPAEVRQISHMLVQVYLHLYEETEKVKAFAQESDKNAERRDYIPLQCKLKKGDKVDVLLNIYGETLLMSDKKSVIWQGSFTKCSFDYFVPKDIDVDELSCVAMLTVNGVPVGEMRFITRIVDAPRQLNPEIIAHKYNKVFISYSHQDESKVKFLHEGLELGAVPHFFDRKYLKAGDVFPQVIQDYINSADLFILCWSENASKSEYVDKERRQALERAFPQVKPEQEAKLRIYPMSIEPRAELPSDMKENYHFGEM